MASLLLVMGPLVTAPRPATAAANKARDTQMVASAPADRVQQRREPLEMRRARPAAAKRRLGSAFAVNGGRDVLTAHHVVAGCARLHLETASGRRVAARLVAGAADADMALLEAGTPLPTVAWSPKNRTRENRARENHARPGETVHAVGYPNEGLPRIKPRRIAGSVLAWGQDDGGKRVIAFRGRIRAGNSGGPLLYGDGMLAGLVFAKVDTPEVYRKTGRLVRDVALAYPVDRVRAFLETQGRDGSLSTPNEANTTPVPGLDGVRDRALRVVCQDGRRNGGRGG